jgi:RNA polymerase sigma-70 factor (ECF subfamily)
MDPDWEKFVDNTYESIYRYAFHITSSKAEAEELTQETYTRFLKRWPILPNNYQEARKMLYRTCRNIRFDLFRRAKRFAFVLLKIEPEQKLDNDTIYLSEIMEVVGQLSQQQREVFILRHYHDFSTHSVAELLGISESSVKTHLSRAIAFLKKELSTHE